MHFIKILLIIFQSFLLFSCSHALHNHEVKYKAYLINLDRAEDRLKDVQKQLFDHNIKFQRIKAVDGYNIVITNTKNGKQFTGLDLKNKKVKLIRGESFFIDCGADPEINFIYHRTKEFMMSAGELGCTCSHRLAILDAIRQKLDVVVVFEDDIKIISNEFAFLMHSAINKIPNRSVIYMDAHGSSLKGIIRDRNIPNLFIPLHKSSSLFGAYAIIYDIKAAQEVFNLGKNTIRPIDHEITYLFENHKLQIYLMNKKAITYSPEAGSHIKEMGRPH